MSHKVFIFDFDGTICDSHQFFFESLITLSRKYKFKSIEEVGIENLKNLSTKECLKALKIRRWKLPFILREGRKNIWDNRSSLNLFSGIEDVFQVLKNKDYRYYIVTSNSVSLVDYIMRKNDLWPSAIISCGLFNKHRHLKKISKQNPGHELYYIGDETRDIKAASKAGIKSIAVTWGNNSLEILSFNKPSFIAKTRSELQEIILK